MRTDIFQVICGCAKEEATGFLELRLEGTEFRQTGKGADENKLKAAFEGRGCLKVRSWEKNECRKPVWKNQSLRCIHGR